MKTKANTRRGMKKTQRPRNSPTVGERIIEGLEQAIAWTNGKEEGVRVTVVHVPQVDVREVPITLGLSRARFATKFGFTRATLRNWKQGRSRPDGPARVLLAVIAHHPEAVEDVFAQGELKCASTNRIASRWKVVVLPACSFRHS